MVWEPFLRGRSLVLRRRVVVVGVVTTALSVLLRLLGPRGRGLLAAGAAWGLGWERWRGRGRRTRRGWLSPRRQGAADAPAGWRLAAPPVVLSAYRLVVSAPAPFFCAGRRGLRLLPRPLRRPLAGVVSAPLGRRLLTLGGATALVALRWPALLLLRVAGSLPQASSGRRSCVRRAIPGGWRERARVKGGGRVNGNNDNGVPPYQMTIYAMLFGGDVRPRRLAHVVVCPVRSGSGRGPGRWRAEAQRPRLMYFGEAVRPRRLALVVACPFTSGGGRGPGLLRVEAQRPRHLPRRGPFMRSPLS